MSVRMWFPENGVSDHLTTKLSDIAEVDKTLWDHIDAQCHGLRLTMPSLLIRYELEGPNTETESRNRETKRGMREKREKNERGNREKRGENCENSDISDMLPSFSE